MLEEAGGCGLFQVLLTCTVFASLFSVSWSLLFMAFGNYNPGWYCADEDVLSSQYSTVSEGNLIRNEYTNKTISFLPPFECEAYRNCSKVVFNKESSTLVTEWGLACDTSWVTDMMISLKLAGVCFGTVISSYLSNSIGRKATHYGTLFLAAILNLIAAFSVNWEMYSVLQFLLGLPTGSTVILAYLYSLEFVVSKWRSVVTAIPLWSVGCISFALAAMILKDWRQLHICAAILTAVCTLPVFWVPESIRWLVVRNKTGKAFQVVRKITKCNRKVVPKMDVIDQIVENEREERMNKNTFNFLDLYRYGYRMKQLVINLAWCCYGIEFYAILYNTKSLSGNFYINLILILSIPLLGAPSIPLMSNTIGRKWSSILLTGMNSMGCFSLAALSLTSVDWDKAEAIRVITFIIIILVENAWATLAFYDLELFPTMLRSMSMSHASSLCRLGALIAPFVISKRPDEAYISQIAMGTVTLITCLSFLVLPETKGKPMEEFSITVNRGETKQDNGTVLNLAESTA